MRVRMAVVISQSMQSVDKSLLESWLSVKDESFDRFVGEVCGWTVEGETVNIPLNKENEARGTVVRENVKFDRKSCCWREHLCLEVQHANNLAEFSRMIKRAYEQPA